jgi:hypothetical protein
MRRTPRTQMLVNRARAFFQKFQRLSNFTAPDCSRANNQRALSDSLADGRKHFRVCQQFGGAYSRPRFKERRLERIHEIQPEKPEVAHRPRNRPNIERIPRRNKHYAHTIEFGWSSQGALFYRSGCYLGFALGDRLSDCAGVITQRREES